MEEIKTNEIAKDTTEVREKYGNDLSIFNHQVITSTSHIPTELKDRVKYYIKVLNPSCYIVVFDQTLKEALEELKSVNGNV